jgi:hypothetical protein
VLTAACFKRNVAFRVESHPHLLSPKSNILTRVLLPLCGPEEFPVEELDKLPADLQLLPTDKQREADATVRAIHLETLILLCSTAEGRRALCDQNVYRVVQMMHAEESEERNKELATRLVGLLVREEEAAGQISTIDDDNAVEEV